MAASSTDVATRGHPPAAARRVSSGLINSRVSNVFLAGALGCSVALIAFVDGGYWPQAWGWLTLPFLWAAAVALAVGAVSLSQLEKAFLGAMAAVVIWTASSTAWGPSGRAMLEAERSMLYLSAIGAALLVVRKAAFGHLLGGVWAASSLVCGYALLTRLLPERLGVFDQVGGYRLSQPLGYWNALGVFAALGALLALGLAAHSRSLPLRLAAAASLPILVTTLYFTFSRGAWIALGIGLCAAVVVETRRLELVTVSLGLAGLAAPGLLLAYRSDALNRVGASLRSASAQGHRLALIVAATALAGAAFVLVCTRLSRRMSFGSRTRRAYAAALLALLAVGVGGVFLRFGGPETLVGRAATGFSAPPPRIGKNLNARLFNLSSPGRVAQWKVAWREFGRHPWLGAGAGTYEEAWNELRPYAGKVRDTHNLYLETMAELGVVGLAALAAALAAPLAGVLRSRREPLVPIAAAAYLTFLVHAAVDWDWEVPAVTIAALFCGAAIVVAARREGGTPTLRAGARAAGLAVVLGLGVLASVGLVGNRAEASADDALQRGDVVSALAHARSAHRWAPWSADAVRLLAEAQLAEGRRGQAQKTFREAVSLDRNDWTLWFERAQATGGRERRRALGEARRLNPLSPEIQSFVAASGGRR